MNNDTNLVGMTAKTRMFADVTYLMLKGAGFALIFVLALWLVMAITIGIGKLLPERSREAPDPNLSSISAPIVPDHRIV